MTTSENPLHVLVVDDDWLNRELLEGFLAALAHTATFANSGEKALQLLEDITPDVVLSDIRMPDMDGLTLCRAINAQPQTAHIPVILMTALDFTADEHAAALNAGAVTVLRRGFTLHHLADALQQSLRLTDDK